MILQCFCIVKSVGTPFGKIIMLWNCAGASSMWKKLEVGRTSQGWATYRENKHSNLSPGIIWLMRIHLRTAGRTEPLHEESPHASTSNKGTPEGASYPLAQEIHSPSRGGGGRGRRISWDKSLSSASPSAFPSTNVEHGVGDSKGSLNEVTPEVGRDGGGGSRSENQKPPNALGWSDGFASLPEVQMQVLMEVGNLVRAAARKRGTSQREWWRQCFSRAHKQESAWSFAGACFKS